MASAGGGGGTAAGRRPPPPEGWPGLPHPPPTTGAAGTAPGVEPPKQPTTSGPPAGTPAPATAGGVDGALLRTDAARPSGATTDTAPVRLLDRPDLPPRTRRDAGLWLIFAVSGFVAGQIIATVLAVVAAAVAGRSAQLNAISHLAVPPEWYVASSLIGLWVGFFGGPWLASRLKGSRSLVRDVGLRFKAVDVAGVGLGLAGQAVVTLLYTPFIHDLKNFNGPTQKLTGAAHGGGFVVIAILTVVGAPFFEELFFRGLLLRGLLRFLAPTRLGVGTARTVAVVGAVALDGLLFALAHGEWEQFAGLALFGMALAVVAYRTGRLGMNIVAHCSFNLVAILALASSNGGVLH